MAPGTAWAFSTRFKVFSTPTFLQSMSAAWLSTTQPPRHTTSLELWQSLDEVTSPKLWWSVTHGSRIRVGKASALSNRLGTAQNGFCSKSQQDKARGSRRELQCRPHLQTASHLPRGQVHYSNKVKDLHRTRSTKRKTSTVPDLQSIREQQQ